MFSKSLRYLAQKMKNIDFSDFYFFFWENCPWIICGSFVGIKTFYKNYNISNFKKTLSSIKTVM